MSERKICFITPIGDPTRPIPSDLEKILGYINQYRHEIRRSMLRARTERLIMQNPTRRNAPWTVTPQDFSGY